MSGDDSYLRSLSSLSCGLLDGLCQAEDEEEFSAEEQLPEPEEEAPESEEEDFAPRVVKPVSTPTPKKRVAVSRDAIETFKEHLRKGLAVTKHCSNGKTKPRVLFCDDACAKLGWQQPNGTPAKNTDLLPLRSVVEIRAGVEVDKQGSREDPKGRTLMGTPTLRKCIPAPLLDLLRANSAALRGKREVPSDRGGPLPTVDYRGRLQFAVLPPLEAFQQGAPPADAGVLEAFEPEVEDWDVMVQLERFEELARALPTTSMFLLVAMMGELYSLTSAKDAYELVMRTLKDTSLPSAVKVVKAMVSVTPMGDVLRAVAAAKAKVAQPSA